MSFFPAYFSLEDRKILLVGGGAIALEKLEKLLDFTDKITIIAAESSSSFMACVQQHGLTLHEREYQKGDIDGFDMVIVATDTLELHRAIYEESRTTRVLINSVDDTAYCDFIFPSYIKRGDLTIAVSTGGASPAMAKRLRRYLEALIPPQIEDFLAEMKRLREELPKGKERMNYFSKKSDLFMKNYFK